MQGDVRALRLDADTPGRTPGAESTELIFAWTTASMTGTMTTCLLRRHALDRVTAES